MTREEAEVLRAAVAWYEALGPRVSWQDATGTAMADAVRRYKVALPWIEAAEVAAERLAQDWNGGWR